MPDVMPTQRIDRKAIDKVPGRVPDGVTAEICHILETTSLTHHRTTTYLGSHVLVAPKTGDGPQRWDQLFQCAKCAAQFELQVTQDTFMLFRRVDIQADVPLQRVLLQRQLYGAYGEAGLLLLLGAIVSGGLLSSGTIPLGLWTVTALAGGTLGLGALGLGIGRMSSRRAFATSDRPLVVEHAEFSKYAHLAWVPRVNLITRVKLRRQKLSSPRHFLLGWYKKSSLGESSFLIELRGASLIRRYFWERLDARSEKVTDLIVDLTRPRKFSTPD